MIIFIIIVILFPSIPSDRFLFSLNLILAPPRLTCGPALLSPASWFISGAERDTEDHLGSLSGFSALMRDEQHPRT